MGFVQRVQIVLDSTRAAADLEDLRWKSSFEVSSTHAGPARTSMSAAGKIHSSPPTFPLAPPNPPPPHTHTHKHTERYNEQAVGAAADLDDLMWKSCFEVSSATQVDLPPTSLSVGDTYPPPPPRDAHHHTPACSSICVCV